MSCLVVCAQCSLSCGVCVPVVPDDRRELMGKIKGNPQPATESKTKLTVILTYSILRWFLLDLHGVRNFGRGGFCLAINSTTVIYLNAKSHCADVL